MQNYTRVFADTMGEFVSLIVPTGQEDQAKGQITVRAALKIFETNQNIGHIGKTGGQTQFPTPSVPGLQGVSVDALRDKSDGSGADYLTDVDVPGRPGFREVRLAYSTFPPNPSNPATGYVQPNQAYVDLGGPLRLKQPEPGPGPDPNPEPNPRFETAVLESLARLEQASASIVTKLDALAIQSDDNTEKIQTQIHDLVDDVEDTMKQVLPLITCKYTGTGQPGSAGIAGAIGGLLGNLFPRTRSRGR